jgi:hypothetical protein
MERDLMRQEALQEMAAVMIHEELFTEAREVALLMERNSVQRAEVLRELAVTMAHKELFTEAHEVAQTIADGSYIPYDGLEMRTEALWELTAALARTGQVAQAQAVWAQAREVAIAIGDRRALVEALSNLCYVVSQTRRFAEALTTAGLQTLDDFLQILVAWQSAFEQIESGLAMMILKESVRIVGWVRPDWQKIYEILNAPTALPRRFWRKANNLRS